MMKPQINRTVRGLVITVGFLVCSGILLHPETLSGAGIFLEPVSFTTRYNLRRSENGRYIGYTYQEHRTVVDRLETTAEGRRISGRVYVFEETLRDLRNVARRVDDIVRFSYLEPVPGQVPSGTPDRPAGKYPDMLGFPVFPDEPIEPGTVWQAPGIRVLDPLGSGIPTRVPFLSEYRYHGVMEYYGREVHHISAAYGVRYLAGRDPFGDPEIREIRGSHEVTLLFDTSSQTPVLFRDMIQRTTFTAGGGAIELQGFGLTWFDETARLDRAVFTEEAGEILRQAATPQVHLEQIPEGVMIRLEDIRFVADQAIVLPEERSRLDAVARVLRTVPEKTILIVGHTAEAGTREGQERLSVERARAMIEQMERRGVEQGRLLYEGRGAREPIAPNDTAEGRARSRRVEFIILD